MQLLRGFEFCTCFGVFLFLLLLAPSLFLGLWRAAELQRGHEEGDGMTAWVIISDTD